MDILVHDVNIILNDLKLILWSRLWEIEPHTYVKRFLRKKRNNLQ